MQPFISQQSIISVLLLNSASLCHGAGSESTTVTVNNSTRAVCNVSTVYRHQRPDQLLNYYECQRHASMLENESQVKKMCMSSVLSCIQHRLAVKTCADALKSLSTAAELAGVQFN